MKNMMGIINLYEKNRHIIELTNHRPVAAIPFLGRYRIIDFALSNMSNSGITNVGVFIQEKPRPLTEHLGDGKYWELAGKKDGLFIFYPYYNTVNNLYTTEIKTFKENLDYIKASEQEYVIITSSYMVCNIDYTVALEHHKRLKGDITLLYKQVDNANEEFLGCDIIDLDKSGRVQDIKINRGEKSVRNISMEAYIMKREFLLELIEKASNLSAYFSLRETLAYMAKDYIINTFEFKGYLICINTLAAYYKYSMELLNPSIRAKLFKEHRPIYTVVRDNPPAFYGSDIRVVNSLVANGSILEGTVENSIIARGVKIGKGAVVKNSILMSRCVVEEGVNLQCVIADKNTIFSRVKEIKGTEEEPLVFEKNSII